MLSFALYLPQPNLRIKAFFLKGEGIADETSPQNLLKGRLMLPYHLKMSIDNCVGLMRHSQS
jgi:hypothetical protein